VFIALFLVEKVPLNCTSAIKSLSIARICQQSVYDRAKSEYSLHFSHTTHRAELLFIVFLFDRKKNVVGMQHVQKVDDYWIIALDVLSHSPAALGTISRRVQ
jgi:hypothetical protein